MTRAGPPPQKTQAKIGRDGFEMSTSSGVVGLILVLGCLAIAAFLLARDLIGALGQFLVVWSSAAVGLLFVVGVVGYVEKEVRRRRARIFPWIGRSPKLAGAALFVLSLLLALASLGTPGSQAAP